MYKTAVRKFSFFLEHVYLTKDHSATEIASWMINSSFTEEKREFGFEFLNSENRPGPRLRTQDPQQ